MRRLILKNFSWLSLGEMVSKFAILFIVILVSRYLGVEQLGVYSFVLGFVGMFSVLADFGTSKIFIREAAIDETKPRNTFETFRL